MRGANQAETGGRRTAWVDGSPSTKLQGNVSSAWSRGKEPSRAAAESKGERARTAEGGMDTKTTDPVATGRSRRRWQEAMEGSEQQSDTVGPMC